MQPFPQRAREPHEKAARRQAMLDVARDLMDDRTFQEIGVGEIPDALGLAKGTVYRYFSSKEEVFLAVLEQDFVGFAEALDEELGPLAGTDDLDAVVEAITAATVARPRMCDLLAIMPSVLERNVSPAAATEFQMTLAQTIRTTSQAVGNALPCLDPEQIPELVVAFQALVIGLWRTAHPNPSVAAVVDDPALEFLRIDFEEHLHANLRRLMIGCAREA